MTHYMLDTNICIYIMKRHPPEIYERLSAIAIDDVAISSIVLAELRYGIGKSYRKAENQRALNDFLVFCNVRDWPSTAAAKYGEIRVLLEQQGRNIGGNDLLIAAHALDGKATLVTNNDREFGRVPDLSVENWAA